MSLAENILSALSCEFTDLFTKPVSALACPEPIVLLQGAFEREALMADEERGTVPVTVLVVRGDADAAEAAAVACERLIMQMDWEPYADAGEYRIIGIDTTAPAFKEIDSSGRTVWSFAVTVMAVREL